MLATYPALAYTLPCQTCPGTHTAMPDKPRYTLPCQTCHALCHARPAKHPARPASHPALGQHCQPTCQTPCHVSHLALPSLSWLRQKTYIDSAHLVFNICTLATRLGSTLAAAPGNWNLGKQVAQRCVQHHGGLVKATDAFPNDGIIGVTRPHLPRGIQKDVHKTLSEIKRTLGVCRRGPWQTVFHLRHFECMCVP